MFARHTHARHLVMLAMLAVPAAGYAQNSSKAEELNRQAQSLYIDVDRRVDAARLHLEEVKHRSLRDPQAVVSLMTAAHLFNYANHRGEATRIMEQAAERAIAIGDLEHAAQAFVFAAFLANAERNSDKTKQMAVRAYLLAESPLLSADRQAWIRRSIQSTPVLAQLVK